MTCYFRAVIERKYEILGNLISFLLWKSKTLEIEKVFITFMKYIYRREE